MVLTLKDAERMLLESDILRRTCALIVPTPTSRPAHQPRGRRSTLHSANGFSEWEGKYRRSALGEYSLWEGTRVETANFGNNFILAARDDDAIWMKEYELTDHFDDNWFQSKLLPENVEFEQLAHVSATESKEGRSDDNGTGKHTARHKKTHVCCEQTTLFLGMVV